MSDWLILKTVDSVVNFHWFDLCLSVSHDIPFENVSWFVQIVSISYKIGLQMIFWFNYYWLMDFVLETKSWSTSTNFWGDSWFYCLL